MNYISNQTGCIHFRGYKQGQNKFLIRKIRKVIPRIYPAGFYKHLDHRIAEKEQERVKDVMCWIRINVSFLCLRNTIMALRGSRTLKSDAVVQIPNGFSAERDIIDL